MPAHRPSSRRTAVHRLLIAACVASSVGFPGAAAASPATPSCASGREPVAVRGPGYDRLADVALFSGVPQGSTISLARVTLQPGEALDLSGVSYAALAVESGTLGFTFVSGFGIHHSSSCGAGGSAWIDEDGRSSIGVGQALVAEDIPVGTVVAAGAEPLVFLLVALVPAAIDPATGQPILDGVTAARIAYRERQRLRQACKDGTIGTPVASATGDSERRLPRACRE